MSDGKPMWALRHDETDTAFRAFTRYLKMLEGTDDRRRSLHKLAIDMGYKNEKSLEKWSSQYGWVERVTAYDEFISLAIVQREVDGLAEYQENVVLSLTAQLASLDVLLGAKIAELHAADNVSTNDLKRLVDAVKVKDDLARRAGKMPTNFTTKPVDDDDKPQVYIIGGDDG